MAGIAKIASKDFDEINKINSAVLIGLGDAVVADVLPGKTFYAGSTTLLTGELAVLTTIVYAIDWVEQVLTTDWADLVDEGGEVPASALQVQGAGGFSIEVGAISGDMRILYNDVEKSTRALPSGGTATFDLWEGEGIGSAAIIKWQAKADSGTPTCYGTSSASYQTFA